MTGSPDPEIGHVDQHGYEVVVYDEPDILPATSLSGGKKGPYIRRKGGPLRAYRPLEDFPGLHRRFAELPADPHAIKEFVHFYGLLGAGFSKEEEDLINWCKSISNMKYLIQVIDDGRRDEE